MRLTAAIGAINRAGALNLRVPTLRQGSYFPDFLEAQKTSEQRWLR